MYWEQVCQLPKFFRILKAAVWPNIDGPRCLFSESFLGSKMDHHCACPEVVSFPCLSTTFGQENLRFLTKSDENSLKETFHGNEPSMFSFYYFRLIELANALLPTLQNHTAMLERLSASIEHLVSMGCHDCLQWTCLLKYDFNSL